MTRYVTQTLHSVVKLLGSGMAFREQFSLQPLDRFQTPFFVLTRPQVASTSWLSRRNGKPPVSNKMR